MLRQGIVAVDVIVVIGKRPASPWTTLQMLYRQHRHGHARLVDQRQVSGHVPLQHLGKVHQTTTERLVALQRSMLVAGRG